MAACEPHRWGSGRVVANPEAAPLTASRPLRARAVKLEVVTAKADLVQPSRKEFLALAREHTLVPVCRTLTADLETPVSAFLRTAWASRECFLLESVEGG